MIANHISFPHPVKSQLHFPVTAELLGLLAPGRDPPREYLQVTLQFSSPQYAQAQRQASSYEEASRSLFPLLNTFE